MRQVEEFLSAPLVSPSVAPPPICRPPPPSVAPPPIPHPSLFPASRPSIILSVPFYLKFETMDECIWRVDAGHQLFTKKSNRVGHHLRLPQPFLKLYVS